MRNLVQPDEQPEATVIYKPHPANEENRLKRDKLQAELDKYNPPPLPRFNTSQLTIAD
jgi:hypothetical protein